MLAAAPGDVADGVTGLHLARNKGTLVVSPTDEQGLAVVSTLDRIGWYHPTGRVAPADASRVQSSADVYWRGRRRAGIYNYVMLSNTEKMFGIITLTHKKRRKNDTIKKM